MRNVIKGETVSRYTNVDGDTVHKHHVTMNKASASEYEMDWAFDFSGVTREELMVLASRDLVIKARPVFKSLPADALDEWDDRVFSVREILDTENRTTLSPDEKARRAVSKLTDEQKAALIAELTGE